MRLDTGVFKISFSIYNVEVDSNGLCVEYLDLTNYPHINDSNSSINHIVGEPIISNVCDFRLYLNIYDNNSPI